MFYTSHFIICGKFHIKKSTKNYVLFQENNQWFRLAYPFSVLIAKLKHSQFFFLFLKRKNVLIPQFELFDYVMDKPGVIIVI